MTDNESVLLAAAIQQFAGLSAAEFELSRSCWKAKEYGKGDYYNQYRSVCRYLGFIVDGAFRSFVINGETGKETNVFLYSKHQFIVTFKSFINQAPCDYHTQAVTQARIIYISIEDLSDLYQRSHHWERFGRLLAQTAFNIAMERVEGFVFKKPEERYLDLIRFHPDIFNTIPLYHISSYLGIEGPSLSRIRKRISERPNDFNQG